MQGESALVTENVQSFSMSESCGRGIVFALIEEGSGLLALGGVVMKLARRSWRRSCWSFRLAATPDARAGSCSSSRILGSTRSMMAAGWRRCVSSERTLCRTGSASIRLGQNLQRQQIVIAIDDQPRQKVRFAEHDPVGVGILHHALAIGDGITDAPAEQAIHVVDAVAGKQSNRDLRGTAVEGCSQKFAAFIRHSNNATRRDAIGGDNVGPVHPDMPLLETVGAAARNCDGGRWKRCGWQHESILPCCTSRRIFSQWHQGKSRFLVP